MFAARRTVLAIPRSAAAFAPRTFATTPYRADVAATVKEAAKKVNKVVGDAVLGGINAGESLTDKAAKAADNLKESAGPAVDKAKQVSNRAGVSWHSMA